MRHDVIFYHFFVSEFINKGSGLLRLAITRFFLNRRLSQLLAVKSGLTQLKADLAKRGYS